MLKGTWGITWSKGENCKASIFALFLGLGNLRIHYVRSIRDCPIRKQYGAKKYLTIPNLFFNNPLRVTGCAHYSLMWYSNSTHTQPLFLHWIDSWTIMLSKLHSFPSKSLTYNAFIPVSRLWSVIFSLSDFVFIHNYLCQVATSLQWSSLPHPVHLHLITKIEAFI